MLLIATQQDLKFMQYFKTDGNSPPCQHSSMITDKCQKVRPSIACLSHRVIKHKSLEVDTVPTTDAYYIIGDFKS